MRDPRLLEEWALAAAAKRRDAGTRRRASVSESERAEVDRLLADWWSEALSQDLLGEHDKMDHVERLRTKCSSLSPEPQKLALGTKCVGSRHGEVDGDVGARLLTSPAAVVRCAPTAVELDRAVRLLADCWEAVEALEEVYRDHQRGHVNGHPLGCERAYRGLAGPSLRSRAE